MTIMHMHAHDQIIMRMFWVLLASTSQLPTESDTKNAGQPETLPNCWSMKGAQGDVCTTLGGPQHSLLEYRSAAFKAR